LAANRIKKDDEAVNIFYGGSFAEKDGFQYLLAALEIVHNKGYNFKLLLSGKASPHKKDSLFSTIIEKPFVDYKGFLSTKAYFELLASADICCMTRVNSAFANAGFPFKLGEFLASGKVIIASKIGDVENYLTHKESAYLVTPESTEQIVEGLEYCMQNLTTLTNTIGANAKKVAEKHFNAANSSKYLLEKCLEITK
jgi:glycosyltransferase involved in cell wall biosynthesis